jgi:peptidoglycan/xylan/chitin deacetylase (PgdA/CDA1 family)
MEDFIIDYDVAVAPLRLAGVHTPNTWKQRLTALRVFLTRDRTLPVPLRSIAMALAWLTFAMMLFGTLTPSPRFILGRGGDHIVSSQYDPLHKASDWLTGRKYAVLTFDDGPAGNGVDQQILSVLRQHHAHAMFFVVCNKIDDDTSAIITRFESEGHLIGNHSFEHPVLSLEPSSKLTHQIEECSQEIAKVTGHRPRYFRPPYGKTSSSVALSARNAGMQQMLWDANSFDYATKHPEKIIEYTSLQANDASIILMHEMAITASVLDQLLTDLEQHGFIFVLPEDQSRQDAAS